MIWVILLSVLILGLMFKFSKPKPINVKDEEIQFELSEMPTIVPTPTPNVVKKKRGRKPKKS
jgi:hypothetical protein